MTADEQQPPEDFDTLASADPGEEHSCDVRAKAIIRQYVIAATAAGFVPTPVFDIGIVTAVQLKMLHSLSIVYDVPFRRDAGKSIIATLVGAIGANALARGTFGSMVKLVPIIGTVIGAITVPVFAGATTYAIGEIFQQHFAAGGTFQDFEPEKVSAYFREKYHEGQDVARTLKDEVDEDIQDAVQDLAQDKPDTEA